MKSFISTIILCVCFALLHAQSVRILSYNIHHGNPPGHPNTIDLPHIAEVIKAANADLVGIQEVDVRLSRSQMVDQAKELADLTGMHYFFSKGIDLEEGEYGTLILTKHKIIGNRRYDLPMVEKSENRSLAIVDVELPDGKVLSFANTHLDLKAKNKVAQANYIKELGARIETPLILVGDFNAMPNDQTIKILEEQFVRNISTNGPTHPNVGAKNEIDYIMVGKQTEFNWKTYKIISETYASDHLPVFAEIEITLQ
ncbi:endonuclease/exonuclease/phosphatase family protein [Sphingobacterium haloxyli]|uniref:Endonuclease n=1 Tax=Sphingobacterium haloxyli TaxID=2100533 RepID=A0A2S9J0X2_9SPHI|nr:endonuclease/exonuclease/phosphatase family protein [Sphingobacterium haloxyli]PRD46422.1 endonuclease [Sphingobacterium haloxyli]